MDLTTLKPLYTQADPIASVYLDTERAIPQAAQVIARRARALHDRLAEQGADPSTLGALEAEAGSDRGLPAPQGQALFAAGGRIVHREELPRPPAADDACFGRLPRVLPMLALRRDRPTYLLVRVDRTGADLEVHSGAAGDPHDRAATTATVDGDTDPLRKVKPGDWSQARYQRRAENTWDRNARGVAEEVERLAARHRAGLIVLTGDVRARSLLRERLGKAWRDRVVDSPAGGGRAPGSDPEQAEAAARDAARKVARARREETAAQLGRGLADGTAVQGLGPVTAALREAAVDTLVLAPDQLPADAELYWDAAAPAEAGPGDIALEPGELSATHASRPVRDEAAEVLLRAATLGASRLMVVPPPEPEEPGGENGVEGAAEAADGGSAASPALTLRDGVAALLRHT